MSSSRWTSIPRKKYPVAFLIHGGPQGSFDNIFHYRWNAQAYAGAGYAVVMVDFHGSTGYGQAFCDSIRGDWGGKPLVDLQKGLAAALDRYPWMDGDRVGALGASFGGYMVNWIAGQWPDRFRCLVNHDGSLDERMAYFDTEELWFPEWDHQGTPWDNPSAYEEQNPLRFVGQWKTPMLVVHGGPGFPRPADAGPGHVQRLAASRHPQQAAVLPGRVPLGPQAAQLDPLARNRHRLAGPVAQEAVKTRRGHGGRPQATVCPRRSPMVPCRATTSTTGRTVDVRATCHAGRTEIGLSSPIFLPKYAKIDDERFIR